MGRPSIFEQRRIEIGRALQACMVKNGSYESTSVKEIAKQAGLAAGLIHHYFTSKDEILLLMAENSLLAVSNLLDDLLHARSAAERAEKLHELLSDEDQNRFMLMLYTLSLSMPEIKEMILSNHKELKESLSNRLGRRETFTGDPEEVACELAFLLESSVLKSALSESSSLEALLARALQNAFPVAEE